MSKKKRAYSTLSEEEVDRIIYQWSIPPEGRDSSTPPSPGAAWSEAWKKALVVLGVDPSLISQARRELLDRRVHSYYRDVAFEGWRMTILTPQAPNLSTSTPDIAEATTIARTVLQHPTTPSHVASPPIASEATWRPSKWTGKEPIPPKKGPKDKIPKLIDAVITKVPQSLEQISRLCGVPIPRVRTHVIYWKRKGRIVEEPAGFRWS